MKSHHPQPPDWSALKALLEGHRRFWLTTHQNPDGDGLGSELAMWGLLTGLGKEVRIVNPGPLPVRYTFLSRHAAFEPYEPAAHDAYLAGVEAVILLDAARAGRLGPLQPAFEAAPRRLCLDHHPPEDGATFRWYHTDTTAAATGQLVYEGLKAMGYTGDAVSALGAYLALVTDTGSFRFSNSDSRAHRLAAELLEFEDIRPAEIFDLVFGNWDLPRLRLLGHVFTHALVREEGQVVVMPISRELLGSLEATPEDTEGLVDLARNLRDCRVVACLLEQASGIRVSLRSKGDMDVSRVAQTLGGGGHPYASGATMATSLEEATRRVLDLMTEGLRQAGVRAR